MPNPYTHWNSGDVFKPRASQMNAWSDAAAIVLGGQRGGIGTGRPDSYIGGVPNIKVRNNSSGDIGRFGILSVGSPLFLFDSNENEFKESSAFNAYSPGDDPNEVLCVTHEPIKDGEIGLAYVPAPVVAVKIDIKDATHLFATCEDGDTEKLVSKKKYGYPILWHEDGTGTKWAKIILAFSARPMLFGPLVDDPDDGWIVEGEKVSVPYDPVLEETWAVEGFVVSAVWDGFQYAVIPPAVIIGQLEEDLVLDGVADCQTLDVFGAGTFAYGEGNPVVKVFDFLGWGTLSSGTKVTAQLDTQQMRYVVNGAACEPG